MPYLLYPIFAILSFLTNLLAWLLCLPIAALSVWLKRDTAPWPLSLLHTVDDTLDGGQHQLGWPVVSGWRLIWQRSLWIVRNPAGGFDNLLGLPRGPLTEVVAIKLVAAVGEPGFKQIHVLKYNGHSYFSYRTNKLWLGWNPYGPRADTHIFKFSLRND